METKGFTSITVEATVNAPVDKVWDCWAKPEHITQWTFASPDWHAPFAENDLRKDGGFKTTMAAKDGSFSFDFEGIYTDVVEHRKISYVLGDGRTVNIMFKPQNEFTIVTETFDAETENPIEMQKDGWQSILDNFKKYVELSNDRH